MPRALPPLFGAAIAALVSVLLAVPAAASPADDKRAEAERIRNQIASNGARISAAAEAFNGARYRAEQAERQIADAQVRIEQSQAETDRLKVLVNERAAEIYKQASGVSITSGEDETLGDARVVAAARDRYAAAATQRDEDLMAGLASAIEDLDAQKAQLASIEAQARAEQEAAAARQREIEELNSQQQQLLNQVEGELRSLIAAEEAARRAAEDRAAAARSGNGSGSSGGTTNGGGGSAPAPRRAPAEFPANLPPPSPLAGAAIAFARAQLGKPYRYAASGPDAYDCSGLTMAAYRAAGLSLPHYSGAQYSMFPKVPLSQLAPGDLVFRGPGGSQHVALYIGNGLVIDAPHTGEVVQVRGMGRVIGAARPG